jgi:acylphosphatase
MANARAHLLIRGRVQGVFYRAFTEDTAQSLNLKGWVRNTPGGDVEAVLEGDKKAIQEAIDKCHQGPPASNVTDIDVSWEDFKGEFPSFSVKYF